MSIDPQDRSKKTSRLWLWGAIAFVVLAIAGVAIKIVGVASRAAELVQVMDEASKAPGTDILRTAGCITAQVIDKAGMRTAIEYTFMGNDRLPPRVEQYLANDLRPAVICFSKTDISCEKVAQLYGATPDSFADFLVAVTVKPQQRPRCAGVYTSEGRRIAEMMTRQDQPFFLAPGFEVGGD